MRHADAADSEELVLTQVFRCRSERLGESEVVMGARMIPAPEPGVPPRLSDYDLSMLSASTMVV